MSSSFAFAVSNTSINQFTGNALPGKLDKKEMRKINITLIPRPVEFGKKKYSHFRPLNFLGFSGYINFLYTLL